MVEMNDIQNMYEKKKPNLMLQQRLCQMRKNKNYEYLVEIKLVKISSSNTYKMYYLERYCGRIHVNILVKMFGICKNTNDLYLYLCDNFKIGRWPLNSNGHDVYTNGMKISESFKLNKFVKHYHEKFGRCFCYVEK